MGGGTGIGGIDFVESGAVLEGGSMDGFEEVLTECRAVEGLISLGTDQGPGVPQKTICGKDQRCQGRLWRERIRFESVHGIMKS